MRNSPPLRLTRGSVIRFDRKVSTASRESDKYQMVDMHKLLDPLETEILIKLNELEQEYKLFVTYDLVEHHSHYMTIGGAIYEFINKHLYSVLRCGLKDLKDRALIDLILNAFFKKEDTLVSWSACECPLFAGLLAIFISERMRKEFRRAHEPVIAEQFEEMQERFDIECTQLLDQCFHKDEKSTRSALELNYHHVLHKDGCHSENFLELMAIASMGKANKFLAHPSCQRAIERRWQPGFKLGQVAFYFYFFFPVLFLLKTGPVRMKRRDTRSMRISSNNSTAGSLTTIKTGNMWYRIKCFYTSPNSKYVIHTLFRGTYVGFYAFVLVTASRKTITKSSLAEYWDDAVILTWQAAYLVEMAMLIYQQGFVRWSGRYEYDLIRNLIIITNLVLLSIAVVIPYRMVRVFSLPLADAAFYLSFVFATVRSMKVLNVDAFFGSIVLMIHKMTPIMLKFIFVFIVFWFTYAVCHISIAGHYKSTPNISDFTLPWLLFSNGAYEIFGEADEEDKLGNVSDCSSAPFSWDNITDSSVQCLFRTSMVPFILFMYMLVSSIMLVNLVTALLTKKYEDISKYSHIYWKCKLYDRLVEYEEKLWLPAPLSLLFYILKLCLTMLFMLLAFARCMIGPVIRINKILTDLLNMFEGQTYGLVDKEDACNAIQALKDNQAIQFIQTERDIMVKNKLEDKMEVEQMRRRIEKILCEFERPARFRAASCHGLL